MPRAVLWQSAQDSSRPKAEEVVGCSRYSATKSSQLLAPIREYERILGAYDAQGYGGMIRKGISANRAEYNRGCR